MSNQIGSLKMGQKFKKTPAGEIPVDWGVAIIADLCQVNPEVIKESTPPDTQLKYIDIAAIERTGNVSVLKLIEFKVAPSRARRIVKAGDIIVSTVRPYLKAFARITDLSENLIASTGFAVLRARPNVNGSYVYQHVLSDTFVKYLEEKMTGSSYPAVNSSDVAEYQIPVPTAAEQENIGRILSDVDTLIDKVNAEIKKTKKLKKGLMCQLLTRGIGHKRFKKATIGQIPSEWDLTPLGELAEVRRGASPRPIDDAKYFGDGPGWVRIMDVTRSIKYLRTTAQQLSPLGVESSVLVKPGDVIMSICATIGKPVILDMQACIHDGFVFFDKLSKSIINDYLYYFLQFKESEFASSGQPGAQKNLNIDIVSRMLVPLPGLKEQKEILSIISALDDAIKNNGALLEKAIEFKKGLMKVLLTGKARTRPQ